MMYREPNNSALADMELALTKIVQAVESELAEVVIRIGVSGQTTVTLTKKIRLHVEREA